MSSKSGIVLLFSFYSPFFLYFPFYPFISPYLSPLLHLFSFFPSSYYSFLLLLYTPSTYLFFWIFPLCILISYVLLLLIFLLYVLFSSFFSFCFLLSFIYHPFFPLLDSTPSLHTTFHYLFSISATLHHK